MKRWLKRLLIVLAIPFLTVALTACPGPDNGADVGDPAIEESAGDPEGALEEGDDDAEDVEDEIEEGEEEEAD